MDLKNKRIGYTPYLPDLSQPGDRRRFPYYAKRNYIPFEIADISRQYDIILLTAPSNLSRWLVYKNNHPKTKFLFEMVDSLVFPSNLFNTVFKGPGRYLIGKEDQIIFNYQKILNEWIRVADCVICSNEVLRKYVLERNPNAVLSPDYLESEYSFRKQNFEINGKMKLVWEGQASVLSHFLSFKEVLKEVSDFCELHIISTDRYPVIPKVYFKDVQKLLDRLPINTKFHKWDIQTHSQILSEADCAIIPINRKNKFGWYKPANKLVSFWFVGLPTVVSNTPAYTELMNKAGTPYYCSSKTEWISIISHIHSMKSEEREKISKKNLIFVKQNYSDQILDKIWESIFNSILLT